MCRPIALRKTSFVRHSKPFEILDTVEKKRKKAVTVCRTYSCMADDRGCIDVANSPDETGKPVSGR